MASAGNSSRPLRRLLGYPTALCVGLGVAIGSGIFRTPGEVAAKCDSSLLILAAWVFGGVFVLSAGMVSAELATRFPQAGGEYVYLREAYGNFVAFFFGWAYTIFIIGGGAASIAAAFGDFTCELIRAAPSWSGAFAAAAVIGVTIINAFGLRAGAGVQNALTVAKVAALLAIAAIGLACGTEPLHLEFKAQETTGRIGALGLFSAVIVPVLWAFDGTTDAVKMAEEVENPRRALPRALIQSALALTVLYVLVNVALLRLLPVMDMAEENFVPGAALARLFGVTGLRVMLVVAMLTCLGSLSSTVLATIRVTFALARDGLTFRPLARMSENQAPVPALLVVCAFAVLLVTFRSFRRILDIYFFASSVLFGLSYASLIIFRRRERQFPPHVYRCPIGTAQAVFLIVVMFALAAGILVDNPADAAYTAGLLAVFAGMYFVWKKRRSKQEPVSGR